MYEHDFINIKTHEYIHSSSDTKQITEREYELQNKTLKVSNCRLLYL